MAYLLITLDGKPATRRPLDGPTIVGRAMDSAVWIDDSRLSRQHCRIEPSADGSKDGWTVIDLNSKNGTIIKGERISSHKLEDGDEIVVGRARITFHARSAPPQRPSAPTVVSGPAPRVPSMADTLVDSRFPTPQINPQLSPQPAPQPTPRLDQPRPLRPKTDAHRTIAFQRPPATPQVSDASVGLLHRLWRRVRALAR